MVILTILGIVLALNLFSFIINRAFFSHEIDSIEPYGNMVEVSGKKMHIYSMGVGEKTIVLLPGFGVALPCADFGPLMRELSKEYTVVCIEYFGVGFSDGIDTPRTNENYTEEIRAVLSGLGFKAPYVLMPHSGSGIYSEYYATKYPGEVSAMIMLDTTSSVKLEPEAPKFLLELSKVQQAIGLGRIFNPLVVSSMLSMTEKSGYTEKEIEDYTKFMNHVNNDTIIGQTYRLNDNIREVMGMDFPDIPVLMISASETVKKVGKVYEQEHIKGLGDNVESITLDGSHFIYHNHVQDIFEVTLRFLEEGRQS